MEKLKTVKYNISFIGSLEDIKALTSELEHLPYIVVINSVAYTDLQDQLEENEQSSKKSNEIEFQTNCNVNISVFTK